jgi:hypothetical protein
MYTTGGRAVRTSSLLNPTRVRAQKNEEMTAERLRLQSKWISEVVILYLC